MAPLIVQATPRWHARRAHDLLHGIIERSEEIAALDQMQRLELAATGGIKQFNDDARYTIELAQTHALTAVALSITKPEEEA